MKLTEAKLKQMILEALKKKRFQDFGIPTPDEKLKAELGDEMFDKIQTADLEQSEAFKQSFDSNYPSRLKQETFEDLLKPFGFKIRTFKYNHIALRKRHDVRTWTKKNSVNYDLLEFHTEYSVLNGFLRYLVAIKTKIKRSKQITTIARGKIEIPKFFNLSLLTEQEIKDADALVLSREKEKILEALEEYK